MRYFDHDTTASGDDLILALRLKHGGAAVDCYWAILEQIYREEAPISIAENRPETQSLTVRLAIAYRTLSEYVATMVSYGLLVADEVGDGNFENVISERAMANIEAYRAKCETNRLNGQKGGKVSGRKANAKRTLTQSVSERKAKKRKEKKVVGSLYGNPTTDAARGADAETAPPTACQACGGTLEPTNSFVPGTNRRYWHCADCGWEEVCDG